MRQAITDRAAQSAEELAFLRAIVANLSDITAQLIYCDWLEERGDPRGCYLRDCLNAFANGEPLPESLSDISSSWDEMMALPERRKLRGNYAHLEPYFNEIVTMARPAIHLEVGELIRENMRSLGESRVAGQPDLPVGLAWPTLFDEPMQFLMQLQLADLQGTLAGSILPSDGLLTLFIRQDREYHLRSIYTRAGASGRTLERRELPRNYSQVYPSRRVRFRECLRYPIDDPEILESILPRSADHALRYANLVRAEGHFLLAPWMNDCRRFSHIASGYIKLLELQRDSTIGWNFGDSERFYLFANVDNIQNGVFTGMIAGAS